MTGMFPFTSKWLHWWGGKLRPIEENTRRTAEAADRADGRGTTATVTQVSDSATSVTLLAANDARVGASFFNDSTADAYLKWGATASTADYTVKLVAGAFYELPQPVYVGVLDAIWTSAAGGVMAVTELA